MKTPVPTSFLRAMTTVGFFGFLVCNLITLSFQQLNGAGIAAIKDQSFHNDSAAKPLVYTEMTDIGGPFITYKVSGKNTSIDKSKIAAQIEVLSSIPNQIIDASEIGKP